MNSLNHHPHDKTWIEEQVAKLSEDFHSLATELYIEHYHGDGAHDGERRRNANNALLDFVDKFSIASGGKRLIENERLPMICAKLLECFGLDKAAKWAMDKGARVPVYPEIEKDIHAQNSRAAVASRLCSPEWWGAQLIKKYRRDVEVAQIRKGKVCKGVSPYVSELSRESFEYRQQQLEAWKKQAILIADDGSEISLDSVNHEHTTAFVRFAEVMARVNGMASIAADNYLSPSVVAALPEHLTTGKGGALVDVALLDAVTDHDQWCGVAFTLTVPSRFHRFCNGLMI